MRSLLWLQNEGKKGNKKVGEYLVPLVQATIGQPLYNLSFKIKKKRQDWLGHRTMAIRTD